MRDSKGRYIKGSIPSNKGLDTMPHCLDCGVRLGDHRSSRCPKHMRNTEWKAHMSKKAKENGNTPPTPSGSDHYAWKGDGVGYTSLHQWVARKLGKANHCSFDSDHTSTRYHWANVSGLYKRDVTDWMQLCPSCHIRYDKILKSQTRTDVFNGRINLNVY